jgi:glycosyltransferase involved in cell wall biosynthesis
MTRALLVCPEPLGHRRPAGIGIRFLEVAKALTADGHSVKLLSRDGGEDASITPENLLRYSAEADVAIVQGHKANEFFAHARPIPTAVDVYDVFIVENFSYHAHRGAEVFTHDHETLIRSLLRGDTFLCATNAQRMFFIGMLLAVGRVNPLVFEDDPRLESLVRIAPFGVPPPRDLSRRNTRSRRILFGGIYDWYDPILAIDAVAIARKTIPDLTLTFNSHPNPQLTPQGKLAEAIRYAKRLDFVTFESWVPYEDRGTYLDDFALALLTFPQSLETDLSMRTRAYDYLWSGLPVVTSSAPGIDELLERYNAGIVVRSQSPEEFAAAVVRAMDMPAAEGTRRFVEEHQWPDTLKPLLDFVREPRFDPYKEEFAMRPTVPEKPRSILGRIKRRIGGGP